MERPTLGEALAAAAGAALLVGMSLTWFGVEITATQIRGAEALADQAGDRNAWQSFGFIDLVLFAAAVLALAPLGARLTGGLPDLPVHPGAVVAGVGVAALLAAIIGVTDPPVKTGTFAGGIVVDVAREPGAWLSVAASAGILAAGALWSRSDDY